MAHSTRASTAEPADAFRRAFDAAPIGMAIVAPDGRWLRFTSRSTLVLYTDGLLDAAAPEREASPEDLGRQLARAGDRPAVARRRALRAGDRKPAGAP